MVLRWTAAVLLCVLGAPAGAETYHVAPGGSDSHPGTSAEPWRTLQRAANKAHAGDTVRVADGTYAPLHIEGSGTADKPITFQAQNRHGATIAGTESWGGRLAAVHVVGDYVVLDGFAVRPAGTGDYERGIRASGSEDNPLEGLVVRHCEIVGAHDVGIGASFAPGALIEDNDVSGSKKQHGIYYANSGDRPVIRRNVLHGNYLAGLHMNGDESAGGDGVISGALVESNVIYGNGTEGSGAINLDGVTDSTIRNNLLYDNHGQGIVNFAEDGASGSKNNRVLNNTVIMAPGSSHALRFKSGSTGGYVRNNILVQLGQRDSLGVDASSLAGLDSDYNFYTRLQDTDDECCIAFDAWIGRHPTLDRHSRVAPPLAELFVSPTTDPQTADYHLKEGSPARGAGADGADLGAYERSSK
jgi:hypothetical protein